MRQVLNFNAKWAFAKHANEVPTTLPNDWYWVNLPHCWNNIDGQDGANDYFRGTCYYAKSFEKADLPDAQKYYLEIRGANSSAEVYLNGEKLASHDGGYSTWRVDFTDYLKNENLLVIAVDNSANDTVYPQTADFTFYGGLYRDVNIICVNESHFDLDYYGGPGIAVTPEIVGSDAKIKIDTYLTNTKDDQSINYTIKDADGNIIATTLSADTSVELEIKNVHL